MFYYIKISAGITQYWASSSAAHKRKTSKQKSPFTLLNRINKDHASKVYKLHINNCSKQMCYQITGYTRRKIKYFIHPLIHLNIQVKKKRGPSNLVSCTQKVKVNYLFSFTYSQKEIWIRAEWPNCHSNIAKLWRSKPLCLIIN